MEYEYLNAGDFMRSKACSVSKKFEELNTQADLSKKESAVSTQIFAGMAKMLLRTHPSLADEYEAEDLCSEKSEVEPLILAAYKGKTQQSCEAAEEANLKEIAKGVRRYYDYEHRCRRGHADAFDIMLDVSVVLTAKDIPDIAEAYPVIKEKPVKVTFHAVFFNKDTGTVEGVIYKGGKPWITNKDAGQDMWMNLMLRALETLVAPGKQAMVVASYYFMKKNRENPDLDWEQDSFDGPNIVSISEVYTATEKFREERSVDDDLISAFRAHFEGKDCTEKDCQSCQTRNICPKIYVKASVPMEQREAKRGKKVSPSDTQQQIIDWKDGICCVIAGAGAGKTECIAENVVHRIIEDTDALMQATPLLTKTGAATEACKKILLTTFTNAGANEMKDRLLGKLALNDIVVDADALNVMTFNTFSFNIVKRYYKELGFKRMPRVIDGIRESRIIVELLNDSNVRGLDYEHFDTSERSCLGGRTFVMKAVEIIKKLQLNPDDMYSEVILKKEIANNFLKIPEFAYRAVLDFYKVLQKAFLEEGLLLFADQEPMAMQMIKKHPEIISDMGLERIVVDEFQDSNDIQMEMIRHLISTDSFISLITVGDDFQAIYAFRDATPDNMLNFEKKLNGKKVEYIYLIDNYRCTPEILNVANQFIAANEEQLPKQLNAFRESGKPVVIRGFYDKTEEAEWLLDRVQKKIEDGYLPEQIAILTRTNGECDYFGNILSKAGIPVVYKNPLKYLDNIRVRAAIDLSRAFDNPDATQLYTSYLAAMTDGELLNLPTNEVVDMIANIKETISELINAEPGYARIRFHEVLESMAGTDEVYAKFLELCYDCEDIWDERQFIADFERYGQKEAFKMEQSYAGVTITTSHSAKGLEWPVVFVTISSWYTADCAKKISGKVNKELEEARRLLYVAMTRARDELFVSGEYVAYGTKADGYVYNAFLKELYDIQKLDFQPVDPNAAAKKAAKDKEIEHRKAILSLKAVKRQRNELLAKCGGDISKLSTEPNVKTTKGGKQVKMLSDKEAYDLATLINSCDQVSLDEYLDDLKQLEKLA